MKQIIIQPSEAEKKQEGYYFMEFLCENCGELMTVMIPFGETSNHVLTCPNCECKTLKNRTK